MIFTDLGAFCIFTNMGGRGGSLTLLILMMICVSVCSQFLDLVLDFRTHNSLGEIEANCRNQD